MKKTTYSLKMKSVLPGRLSRRERQFLDVIFRLERATAEDVRSEIQNPPKNATVRRALRSLEEKGYIKHEVAGRTFVYSPVLHSETAGKSAWRHMVETFFGGSTKTAFVAMLSSSKNDLSNEDIEELGRLVSSLESKEDRNEKSS